MTDKKLGRNWERQRYEDTLSQVYTSQDEQETIFKAVRLRDYQDKEEVRLCIAKDDRLVKALQTPLSKLGEKINEVINYGVVVSYVDRASLIKEVYRLYQGIPVGGYTKMVANLLDGIEVRLNEDYLEKKEQYDAMTEKVIYTGAIDAYFDYKLGTLEYRSVRFENETLDKPNFQGNAAVNYTDVETPWTRIIEHKWFEFGKDEEGNDLPKTVISREYSSEWKPGDEPYYPVNDEKNGALYGQYKELAEKEPKVIFGGRLGEYKYYDMDAVIASALDMCERELA